MKPAITGKLVNSEAAPDYYEAQQNELNKIRDTGGYPIWSWLADAPGVAKAKLEGVFSNDASLQRPQGGVDYTTNDAMASTMDKMRQIAHKQHDNKDYKLDDNEQMTNSEWDNLKNGQVWLKMPSK